MLQFSPNKGYSFWVDKILGDLISEILVILKGNKLISFNHILMNREPG